MKRSISSPVGALCCAVVLCVSFVGAAHAQITPLADRVQAQRDRLVAAIKATQLANGSWSDGGAFRNQSWQMGQTALSVLALSMAGEKPKDPVIVKGVAYLTRRRCDKVYEAAVKIAALAAVDPVRHREAIRSETEFLVKAQLDSGGWTYGDQGCCGSPDNSNSQFALLGLHEAARAGIRAAPSVWAKGWDYFARGQKRDGGWSYKQEVGNSYGSMTTAGVSSLYVCALWEHLATGQCGVYKHDTARIEAGLRWIGRQFTVHTNPQRDRWKIYYLYGLERAATISARRYLGSHDWYIDGAEHLADDIDVAALQGQNWEIVNRAFLLLFLSKGNAPVVVHKARWNGDWDGHRYDAALLTERFGEQLLDQRLAWQVVPLDAPLDHLAAAPVLYISGRGSLNWTDDEIQRLKDYIATGGFVFVEAMEGDERFDKDFRRLVAEHFPNDALTPLAADHRIYDGPMKLDGKRVKAFEAMQGPCWMSLLYCPAGISCPWDTADVEHDDFKLGMNILAFATGMTQLEGKLDRRRREYSSTETSDEKLGGAFVLGQLMHGGNWEPHKGTWRRILAKAHREAGMGLFDEPIGIDPRRESLFRAHLISIAGTKKFTLSAATQEKLRRYVERGGFIYAEASCGSRDFDASFRALMAQMFPDTPLETVPPGHPLLELGRDVGTVSYSPMVLRGTPDLKRPALEYIEIDGRAVVVYSKYDMSSAVSGHPCRDCPAVLEPDASELLLKVILYALAG